MKKLIEELYHDIITMFYFYLYSIDHEMSLLHLLIGSAGGLPSCALAECKRHCGNYPRCLFLCLSSKRRFEALPATKSGVTWFYNTMSTKMWNNSN